MSQQLSNDIDCNGLGMHYNRKLRQDWAYASTHVIPTKRPHFPDVSALFVTDCQINQTQANVTALQNSLSLDGLIKEKTKVDIPTASLFLLGNELTVKYTKDGKVTMYSFSFKEGDSVAVSQNKLVLNGVTYIPIYDKKTGKFSGFYNTAYQAPKDEKPNGFLSLNEGKPTSTYYNGYLAETKYSQNYELFPPNLLAVANESSLAALFNQAQNSKQEAVEDYLGKKLKLYISIGQNSKADLTSIAQACDKVGDDEIILWLHKVSSGVYRYEFYFGKNTPTDTQQREYYRNWLEGLVALPDPMSTYNPLMGLLKGMTDFIKSELIIPPKYWDCTLGADFVGLPFVPVSCEGIPACMDRVQFAFLCGLYDGAVGQVAGIPEFISMLCSSEGRSTLGVGIGALFSTTGWSAIINKVKEAHQVEGCKLYHQIGKDLVDAASLVFAVKGIGTLASKITYAGTVAKFNQASELVLALSQRMVYQGGQLVKNTYQTLGGLLKISLNSGKIVIEVLGSSGQIWKSYCTGGGKAYMALLPVNPEGLQSAIKSIKSIIKDAKGADLLDANGNKLALAELENGDEVMLAVQEEVAVAGSLDFSLMDIPNALQHVKFRDLTDLARRDIVGLHDAIEFFKLRITKAIGNRNFQFPIGKILDEVDEIVILAENNHPTTPGVKIIEYRVPSTDGKLTQKINGVDVNKGYTTGATKGAKSTEDYVKTIYDPAIWLDAKLEKALKDALQDAFNKEGAFVNGKSYVGKTVEGYEIEFWYRDNKVQTFYFK